MKALSLRQPFAWLVVNGFKDIENRSWATAYRGPLLIHAGKARLQPGVLDYVWQTYRVRVPESALRFGGVVGRVELADVVTSHRSKWFRGPFGFVLANARTLPFRAMPGKLKLFDVPA